MAFPEADSLYDLDIAAMKLSDAVEELRPPENAVKLRT